MILFCTFTRFSAFFYCLYVLLFNCSSSDVSVSFGKKSKRNRQNDAFARSVALQQPPEASRLTSMKVTWLNVWENGRTACTRNPAIFRSFLNLFGIVLTTGRCAFSYSSLPMVWNNIPLSIRFAPWFHCSLSFPPFAVHFFPPLSDLPYLWLNFWHLSCYSLYIINSLKKIVGIMIGKNWTMKF